MPNIFLHEKKCKKIWPIWPKFSYPGVFEVAEREYVIRIDLGVTWWPGWPLSTSSSGIFRQFTSKGGQTFSLEVFEVGGTQIRAQKSIQGYLVDKMTSINVIFRSFLPIQIKNLQTFFAKWRSCKIGSEILWSKHISRRSIWGRKRNSFSSLQKY